MFRLKLLQVDLLASEASLLRPFRRAAAEIWNPTKNFCESLLHIVKLDLFHDLHGCSDNLDLIFCCIFVMLATGVSINVCYNILFWSPFLLRSRKNKYFFVCLRQQRHGNNCSPRDPPRSVRPAYDYPHLTLLTRWNGADYSHPGTDRKHPIGRGVAESFRRNRHKNDS